MKIEQKLLQFTYDYHKSLGRVAPSLDGHFKLILTAKVADEPKPVLLVGKSEGGLDGECILVVNPSRELVKGLHPGVAYVGRLLPDIVCGYCDAMVHLWFNYDDNGKQTVSVLSRYTARKSVAARMQLPDGDL